MLTFAPAKRSKCVAQMAESVDALVSNTSGATRAGSTPALGTCKRKTLSRGFFFLHFIHGLFEVSNDVLDILKSYAEADEVRRYAGFAQLLVGELAVGVAGGM